MIPPNVPLRYTAEGPLRTELERGAQAVVSWAKALPDTADIVPNVSEIAGRVLAFGQIARVAPTDGETIQLVLPRLDTTQGGRAIRIMRMNNLGLVFLNAPSPARVDGLSRVLLYSSVRVTTIWYDGAIDYVSDGTALDAGAGL